MIRWRLRDMMERRGIATARELHSRLRLHIVFSEPSTRRLCRQKPKEINLNVLDVLCEVLDCDIGDLLQRSKGAVDPAMPSFFLPPVTCFRKALCSTCAFGDQRQCARCHHGLQRAEHYSLRGRDVCKRCFSGARPFSHCLPLRFIEWPDGRASRGIASACSALELGRTGRRAVVVTAWSVCLFRRSPQRAAARASI